MPNLLHNCTIIIPTRNRPDDLKRTVGKLIDIGLADTQILVLDDASEDPRSTKNALTGLNNAQMLENKNRTGQAEGRNRLLRHSTTKYCICLDDDTYFLQLGKLPALLMEDKFDESLGGLVFHTIRSYDGFREFPPNMPKVKVPLFIGCSIMFNKENVLRVGGYRSFLMYGCEEPELATRLWRASYPLEFEPSVVIEHCHTSEARDHGEYHFLYCRNTILLHTLNYPGVYGLPGGTLRAIKRLFTMKGHKYSKFKGILCGIKDSIHFWDQRTLLTKGQYQARKQFINDTNKMLVDLVNNR